MNYCDTDERGKTICRICKLPPVSALYCFISLKIECKKCHGERCLQNIIEKVEKGITTLDQY